jgi:hypothetical protein
MQGGDCVLNEVQRLILLLAEETMLTVLNPLTQSNNLAIFLGEKKNQATADREPSPDLLS